MQSILWWSAGIDHVPDVDHWMDDAESQRLAGMRYTKRRTEAKLSRYCAKTTVAKAVGRATDPSALRAITIRNAPDGAPETHVEGHELVIAMTDRADWAVAAVMAGADRIGCDLELVEPRSEAFIADYFNPPERARVHDSTEPSLAANLVWSAKESALKVLRTGLRRDTRTVAVAYEDEHTVGDWSPLEVRSVEGQMMPGWWIRYGEFVLTVVAAVATAAPESLERPPPLSSATPGHSWLDHPHT